MNLTHIINMRVNISWRVFFAFLLSGVFGAIAITPYIYHILLNISVRVHPNPLILLFNQSAQTIASLTPIILIGMLLSKRINFGWPLLCYFLEGKKPATKLSSTILISLITGLLTVVLIIIFEILFSKIISPLSIPPKLIPSLIDRLFATFYSAINEELIFRLFIMSFIVWITFKIKSTKDKKPTIPGIWIGIIVSSLIFAITHLPYSFDFIKITPPIILRSLVLNGLSSSVYGFLFWRHGIESAMIAHWVTDLILQIV